MPNFLNRVNISEELIDKLREAETLGNLMAQANLYLKIYQGYQEITRDPEIYKSYYELEETFNQF